MSGTVVLVIFVAAVLLIYLSSRRPAPGANALEAGEAAEPDDVGVIAIEDAIDLHGFQPREIPEVVESYLQAAIEEGHREVRLIHGRGKGVQRQRVREILAAHPRVVDFADAPAHRGGWGATIAWLDVDGDDADASARGRAGRPKGRLA